MGPNVTPVSGQCTKLLPSEALIIGYANWSQCDDKIIHAVRDGVNVVIWFSINLIRDSRSGLPSIQGGPDMDCVASKIQQIRLLPNGNQVVHLISIGGWNSPHPDTSNAPEAVFKALDNWNRHIISRPDKGFYGFDGFDWDIEGNDDVDSQYNHFTKNCLDAMGIIAQCAKRSGYIFGMAPAESYLDPHSSSFDRHLTHDYHEWRDLQPNFKYHGANPYAYILARYGQTIIDDNISLGTHAVNTFDFVTLQLYEGYSHAEYNINVLKIDPAIYITDLVSKLRDGWVVPFSLDSEIKFPDTLVAINPTQLVLGLANGWAGDGKFLFISPAQLESVYNKLQEHRLPIRGFAFWNILDEGIASVSDPMNPVWLAASLKQICSSQSENLN